MTGMKQAHVLYYWPTYSDLVREAGLKPNEMTRALPENQVFESYGRICLHLGKIPTETELRIATRELRAPTHNVYKRFGGIGALHGRFREWLQTASDEFRPVLTFPGWERPGSFRRSAAKRQNVPLIDLALHPFLPTCLQNLDVLARGVNPSPGLITNVSHEFEKRCADAFRCLGFEVEEFGQGRGRAADCVALARREGFAIIVDAKVRQDGYVLGTEDRKFLEYAKRHAAELSRVGIAKIYLAVVGSDFREADLLKLTKYLADAPIRSVDLVTAKALMRMVESSVRDRSKFSLSEIDRELFGNKILAA